MSKASSKAITSSTVSSESAPRSSTNDALEVTSPSSTPNCSTMICFTFSSVADAMCKAFLFMRNVLMLGSGSMLHYFGILFDVVHRVLYGLDGLCLIVRDLKVECLFKGHDQF